MTKTTKLCAIAAVVLMTSCSAAASASNKPLERQGPPDQLIPSKAPVTTTVQSTSNPLNDAFELVYSCASVDARWLARTTSSGVKTIIDTVVNDCLTELQNYEKMVREMAPAGADADAFVTSVWRMLGGAVKAIIANERIAVLNNQK